LSYQTACRHLRRFCIVLAAFLALPRGSLTYEVPLTPASIHEAYVLGQRNDQATADFFNPYLKQLKEEGVGGAHIAEIQILTPFAQVVDESRANAAKGYTEQDAERDYRKRGNMVVVRVLLMFPSAYPKSAAKPDANPTSPSPQPATPQTQNAPLRPENFWQNFQFSSKQHGKVIPTRSLRNKAIYSAATKDAPSVLDGATVWLEYDAKDVASEPVVVEAITPEARNISTTFDLKKLR
jgi:hypothetical protein